jgi:threonine/homoserine/homoserine lactone efflux protein
MDYNCSRQAGPLAMAGTVSGKPPFMLVAVFGAAFHFDRSSQFAK